MILQKYLCREYYVKAILCVTGVFIIGIGVSFMRYADFGIDPYMCFMNGLHLAVFKKLDMANVVPNVTPSFLKIARCKPFIRHI